MKNTETVVAELYTILKKFRYGKISEDTFLAQLEKLCKNRGNASYWWRFFKDDTLANCPQSCKNSLSNQYNKAYLIECIDVAIEAKSITVYLS
jgi:hypothetical protein